jgi:hypothetical protein
MIPVIIINTQPPYLSTAAASTPLNIFQKIFTMGRQPNLYRFLTVAVLTSVLRQYILQTQYAGLQRRRLKLTTVRVNNHHREVDYGNPWRDMRQSREAFAEMKASAGTDSHTSKLFVSGGFA